MTRRQEPALHPGYGSRLLRNRHRNAGDPEVDRAQRSAAGEEQGLPVVATEADVCGCRLAMDDPSELLALGVEDVDAARTAAIDIAQRVYFHAVGHARFRPAKVGEHPIGLFRERAVRREVEGADVATARIVDVEDAFIEREGDPV